MNRQSSNNNRRVRWCRLLRWKNALKHDYKFRSILVFRVRDMLSFRLILDIFKSLVLDGFR